MKIEITLNDMLRTKYTVEGDQWSVEEGTLVIYESTASHLTAKKVAQFGGNLWLCVAFAEQAKVPA